MSDKFSIYVRRCHICDHVTERSNQSVDRCDDCGKCLAPYYFFDEKSVQVYSVDETRPTGEKLAPHSPIRGLSTVW